MADSNALASAIVKTIKIFLFRFADTLRLDMHFTMAPVSFSKGQKAYYTQKIGENPDWEMAGIFADKGIVDPSFQPEVL